MTGIASARTTPTIGILRAVLLHNAGEEMEHACMLIEWIRRHEPLFDAQLREYLFTTKPIVEVEHEAMERGSPIKE